MWAELPPRAPVRPLFLDLSGCSKSIAAFHSEYLGRRLLPRRGGRQALRLETSWQLVRREGPARKGDPLLPHGRVRYLRAVLSHCACRRGHMCRAGSNREDEASESVHSHKKRLACK